MFRSVPAGPPDPVFILSQKVKADTSPEKVDLGVGVYRNEEGRYHELRALRSAKTIVEEKKLGHDYEVTTGDVNFRKNSAKVLFGKDSEAIRSNRVTSVQAISGTGSIHLAALLLSRTPTFKNAQVYIGTPAWGNYEPLFNLVGFEVVKYKYYDAVKGVVEFTSMLDAVNKAPQGSIFVLQGCCHNPSGADLEQQQWRELADAMATRKHFPFFDVAYQGLGQDLDKDAYGLRLFVKSGFELVACQSFSKNFGLYGERVGVCHLVNEKEVAIKVYDQIRSLIRWEFSSSPAYGSRLVNTVLSDETLSVEWSEELAELRKRLLRNRNLFFAALQRRQTPGNWDTVLSSKGLFCFLPLSPQQCDILANNHHIYVMRNGRINVSGLNSSNIERVASAVHEVAKSDHTISPRL